jgi:hypothetical protein
MRSFKPMPSIRSIPSRLPRSLVRVRNRLLPGSESRSAGRSAYRCAQGLRLATPGVLGSGPSSVVSARHCLLRPHPPDSRARSDFAALPLIHHAFAVRTRLGDPRALPYFHCCTFRTCHRPYAGGSAVPVPLLFGPRYQASSSPDRVATRNLPPLPAIPGGLQFRRCIVRFMLRPVRLPSPPDWLRPDGVTCAPPSRLRTLSLPLSALCVAARAGNQARWVNGKFPIVGTSTRPVTAASEAAPGEREKERIW